MSSTSNNSVTLHQPNITFFELASFIIDDIEELSSIIEAVENMTHLEEPTSKAKAIFSLSYLSLELVGVPLMLGLIFYEKNGCDPQKRSLYNQLLSTFWICCIVGPSLIFNLTLLRIYFGTMPFPIGYFCMWIQTFSPVFSLFCWTEIFVYRILQKVKYQYIASRDDNFFFVFLTCFNCLAALMIASTVLLLDEPHDVLVFISTGSKAPSNRRFFNMFLGVVGCLILVLIVTDVIIKKLKTPTAPPVQQANGLYNNQAKNPKLVSYKIVTKLLIVFCLGATLPRELLLELFPDVGFADNFLYRRVASSLIYTLIVPIVIYASNSRLRTFYKRSFWDWAPDCLQRYNPNNVVPLNVS